MELFRIFSLIGITCFLIAGILNGGNRKYMFLAVLYAVANFIIFYLK